MQITEKNDDTLLLRLPAELKLALHRKAAENGRRITAEINTRLRDSIKHEMDAAVPSVFPPDALVKGTTPAKTDSTVNFTDIDEALFEIFRGLSAEKKLALMSLLR